MLVQLLKMKTSEIKTTGGHGVHPRDGTFDNGLNVPWSIRVFLFSCKMMIIKVVYKTRLIDDNPPMGNLPMF
jgi:hypothetical protein